ncbi:MAG: zinc ribbon domain-containing protein [Defluviitaleaceae bacterium]|nr:zinc ribbon domain-containing protein [Defluviitaleaceae bacterium]
MNDLRDKITSITKTVTKTSGDLLKSTKLNMNLSTEENELRTIYVEIGRKVHEIYQYGGSLGTYFDSKYLEILDCERKIADTKEQLSVIKGVRQCPKCGKNAERTAEFCAKCGVKFHSHAPTSAEPPPPEAYHHHHHHEAPPPPPPPRPPEPYAHEIPRPAEWPAPPPPPPTPPPAPAPPVRTTKKCRVCNSENETGTKFCLSCGRILD